MRLQWWGANARVEGAGRVESSVVFRFGVCRWRDVCVSVLGATLALTDGGGGGIVQRRSAWRCTRWTSSRTAGASGSTAGIRRDRRSSEGCAMATSKSVCPSLG